MESKDKKDQKKLNTPIDNNCTNKKNTLEDHKKLIDDEEKNSMNISPEELNQILNQLKEKFDVEEGNIRIVKIEKKRASFKEVLISIVLSYLFDFILIVSLNGYIGFTEYNIFNLLLFSLIFSTIEYISKRLMMRYFFKLMFASLGTILIPVTIISFVFAWLLIPELSLESDNKVFLFFIIFLTIRIVMKMLLMNRQRNKIITRFKGGKK